MTFGGAFGSGTLNGQLISKIYAKNDQLNFATPGIYKDQDVIRTFLGTVDNEWNITGTLAQDDGKYAKCLLKFSGLSSS